MDRMDKKIVMPGELLSDNPSLSGAGTYVSGGKVYASVCGLLTQKGKLSVHPFAGPYIPKKNDYILGYVTVVTPSNWIFDIGCPYEGLLHVSEYPIRVPSEEMEKHFDVGDTVLLKVVDVNTEMKIELTYKDPACRKLAKGRLFEIPFSKVSRVIGHSGSMISMLKSKTGCDIFVGSNGRIWMNGSSGDMDILMRALQKIEKDAQLPGLTDLTSTFIHEQYDLIGLKPHGFAPSSKPAGFAVSQKPAAAEDSKSGTKKVRHMKLKKSSEEKEAESESTEVSEEETESESIKEVAEEKETESESKSAKETAEEEEETESEAVKEAVEEEETESEAVKETVEDEKTKSKAVKEAVEGEEETESEVVKEAAEEETESKAFKKSAKIKETESDAVKEADVEKETKSKTFKKAVKEKETKSEVVKEADVEKETESKAVKKTAGEKETKSGAFKEAAEGKVVEKKSKGSKNAKSGTKKDAKKSEKAKSDEIDAALYEKNNCVCFKSVRFTHQRPRE